MRVTNSSLPIAGYAAIGDQNGDGTPDFLVRQGNVPYIVYGVADPDNDLPKCDPLGTAETRCLDIPNLENTNGDPLGYKIVSGQTGDNLAWTIASGDFDGNGKQELAVGASATGIVDADRGAVYIARHNLGDLCPDTPDLCTLDFSTLGASDVVRIDGPVEGGLFGGSGLSSAGDLNDDGRDDLLVSVMASGTTPPSIYAVYGQDWQTSPIGTETFGPTDGFTLAGAAGTLTQVPAMAGDANGDGRPDIAVVGSGPLFPNGPTLSVAYTPSETPTAALPLVPPNSGQGYLVDSSPDNVVGFTLVASGDLNSDGFGDLSVSNPNATALTVPGAGSATILFGQGPNPVSEPLSTGPSLTADQGFSLVGDASLLKVGGGVASLGDVDDDGIPDFAVASTAGTGQIFLVLGRSLFGNAVTGLAGNVQTGEATVAGTVTAQGRPSTVFFEYGETASYGQATGEESIGKSNQNKFVEADLSGLSAETTYHYRAVVENDLGLKTYGKDRKFKTRAVVPDRCEADPTLPSCVDYDYCADNPAKPGCPDFDYCAANPNVRGCKDNGGNSKDLRPKIRSATKHRVTLKKRARTIRAAKVTCGKAPCRIKRVKVRYVIRGKVYHAGKARFPKGRFRAGKARFVKVTMPGKIFRKAPRGKKIGFVKVRVVAVSKNGVRATRNIAIGIGKR